jgi:hypothetical protein
MRRQRCPRGLPLPDNLGHAILGRRRDRYALDAATSDSRRSSPELPRPGHPPAFRRVIAFAVPSAHGGRSQWRLSSDAEASRWWAQFVRERQSPQCGRRRDRDCFRERAALPWHGRTGSYWSPRPGAPSFIAGSSASTRVLARSLQAPWLACSRVPREGGLLSATVVMLVAIAKQVCELRARTATRPRSRLTAALRSQQK